MRSVLVFSDSGKEKKRQQERQPEKGAGDRRDGREKAESSAGTRRVKAQQQGAEGPGEEVVFFMEQKIPFIKGTPSPPLFYSAIE